MRAPVDLREIVEAVEIYPNGSFSISGERFDAPIEPTDLTNLSARLAQALYQRKYCRPERGSFTGMTPDIRRARLFVEELSQANCGLGTWENGWVVKGIEDDGRMVVRRERDDLLLWVRPDQFRARSGISAIDSMGRVWVGKELREMLQGYYTAFGDADQGGEEESLERIVRFYWHLTAEVAPLWVGELTGRFNAGGVAFHAKVLSDPAAYQRADAGVLYIETKNVARAIDLMPALHQSVAGHLRKTTPMFTKRLARGLAVAEDPGDGRSFGQHRCHLIAEGLVCALEAGLTGFDRSVQAVANRFAEEGLSVTRTWSNAGSRVAYRWPRQRVTSREVKEV